MGGACQTESKRTPGNLAVLSCMLMGKGLLIGTLCGWIIQHWTVAESYGFAALHALMLICLVKHSWHCCLRYLQPERATAFGDQHLSEHSSSTLCRVLSFMDTLRFRVLVYWLFFLVTFHVQVDDAPKTPSKIEL